MHTRKLLHMNPFYQLGQTCCLARMHLTTGFAGFTNVFCNFTIWATDGICAKRNFVFFACWSKSSYFSHVGQSHNFLTWTSQPSQLGHKTYWNSNESRKWKAYLSQKHSIESDRIGSVNATKQCSCWRDFISHAQTLSDNEIFTRV